MSIIPTPQEVRGTIAEDELFQKNMGPGLFFVSGIYDRVANIIEKGLILDERYRVTGNNTSITREEIRKMTKESSQGNIFYIFNIADIFLFSSKKINADFVKKYVTIIIVGGKRYKVARRGNSWLKKAESEDFNFIEIEEKNISELTGRIELK